ncbi:nucleotidyltransferase family protein [bacterium]|nr:nucleotidyltransferase family protein [bacterium]
MVKQQSGKTIKKAMLLAAGMGTRLRPLTYKTPKPLLPIGNHKIIDFPLNLLKRAGIEEVCINLHHLGDQIKEYCGNGNKWNLNITYSFEKEILGTGGGIKKAEFFFDSDFILLNADVLIDIDLKKVASLHFEKNGIMTMVVKELEPQMPHTPLSIDINQRLQELGKTGNHFYAGLSIVNPDLIKYLPIKTFSSLVDDGIRPAMKDGKSIFTYLHTGYWNDVGTRERLNEAISAFSRDIISL